MSHEESVPWPGLESPSCVTEFLGGGLDTLDAPLQAGATGQGSPPT